MILANNAKNKTLANKRLFTVTSVVLKASVTTRPTDMDRKTDAMQTNHNIVLCYVQAISSCSYNSEAKHF